MPGGAAAAAPRRRAVAQIGRDGSAETESAPPESPGGALDSCRGGLAGSAVLRGPPEPGVVVGGRAADVVEELLDVELGRGVRFGLELPDGLAGGLDLGLLLDCGRR